MDVLQQDLRFQFNHTKRVKESISHYKKGRAHIFFLSASGYVKMSAEMNLISCRLQRQLKGHGLNLMLRLQVVDLMSLLCFREFW